MHHNPSNKTEIWCVCTFIIIEIPLTVAFPVKHTSNHGQHFYLQSLPFSHRSYICLLQNRVITVVQDLISLPCSESNTIQSLTAGTLDLHQCHCDQTLPLCLLQKEYLEKDAKSILFPVQALAKSMSYIIRNLSPSGHTYFKYYHHLCKIHSLAALGAPGGTVGPSTTMNMMSLPAKYFGSLLSRFVDWVCTQGSWQGWRERLSPHNLHLSSFVQEMAPFIWINAPCRLITLSTTVSSGISLPGEKSDAFLIALEVQMECRAYIAWLD